MPTSLWVVLLLSVLVLLLGVGLYVITQRLRDIANVLCLLAKELRGEDTSKFRLSVLP